MCDAPEDFITYDRLLGFCICLVDDLEELCDEECRNTQRNRITFSCPGSQDPYIDVQDRSGNVHVSATLNHCANKAHTAQLDNIRHLCIISFC